MERVLLISFLDQLRRTDIKVFVFVLGFLFLQLFLTFVKLEAPPFFLYGMFSENIPVTDTFVTVKIMVNDQPLENYQPPLRERYLLETTAINFEDIKNNHYTDILQTRIESRYPFIYNAVWYPGVSRKIYNSPQAINNYRGWLKTKCLNIAGTADGAVKVVRITSVLNKTTLQLNPVKNEVLEDL
jgi:hypothetical protein